MDSDSVRALLGKQETAEASAPYQIANGDILGIFVEGVLGQYKGDPPIHYPPAESGLPPSIGFPIHVEHNGTISLPVVDPVQVRGKTIVEIKQLIDKAYKAGDKPVLREYDRIFVSLIQRGTQKFESFMKQKPLSQLSRQMQSLTSPRRGGGRDGTVSPSTIPGSNLSEKRLEYIGKTTIDLQIKLQELRNQFGNNHPEARSIERQIELLKKLSTNQNDDTSKIYNGKTYQEWLQIATRETNPKLLLEAFAGLLPTWDRKNENQFFDGLVKLRIALQKSGLQLDHFQLTHRLLTQLSPNQTLLLVAKDIDAGEDLTNKTRFNNFETSANCLSSVDQLPAAKKKTFIQGRHQGNELHLRKTRSKGYFPWPPRSENKLEVLSKPKSIGIASRTSRKISR